jgi:hypothetical protein
LNITSAIFRKGTTTITVSLEGTEATVRDALQTQLASLNGTVSVTGNGSEDAPWTIRFSGYNNTTPVTVEYVFETFGDVTPDMQITPAVELLKTDVVMGTRLLQTIGGVTTSLVLESSDISADASTQAATLQTKLRTLTGDSSLTVTSDATRFFINFGGATTAGMQILSGAGLADVKRSGNAFQLQSIAGELVTAGSVFTYGADVVVLSSSDIDELDATSQATKLQVALRTLTGLESVTVAYNSATFIVTIPGTGASAIKAVGADQIKSLPTSSKAIGTFTIDANSPTVRFLFDGILQIVDLAGATDNAARQTALQTALTTLNPGASVTVDASNVSTLGFVITIKGYDHAAAGFGRKLDHRHSRRGNGGR